MALFFATLGNVGAGVATRAQNIQHCQSKEESSRSSCLREKNVLRYKDLCAVVGFKIRLLPNTLTIFGEGMDLELERLVFITAWHLGKVLVFTLRLARVIAAAKVQLRLLSFFVACSVS